MHIQSLLAGTTLVLLASMAVAGDKSQDGHAMKDGDMAAMAMGPILIQDAYARASTPSAKSGAAFMMIMNEGDSADRLIAASSPVAQRIELHTHKEDDAGIMRMTEVEGGIEIPADGMAMLERGGQHLMFMGLTEPFTDGSAIEVTLTFEQAGDIMVEIPVDLNRKPQAGAHGGHGDRSDQGSATN